jgi:hypothetical protein
MTSRIRTNKNLPDKMQVTRKVRGLAVFIAFVVLCAQAAEPTTGIREVASDEAGKALAQVKVQVCGMEKFSEGTWSRVLRLGLMPNYATDKEGRFLIPIGEVGVAYDLYFDKVGFAPTFLYRMASSSNEMSVVMKPGVAVTGTVRRRVDGKLEPVSGASVELRRPYVDLWYQQRTLTDDQGRYAFRVSPSSADRKWQMVFAGKVVQLEVKEGKSVAGPDFEAPPDPDKSRH